MMRVDAVGGDWPLPVCIAATLVESEPEKLAPCAGVTREAGW